LSAGEHALTSGKPAAARELFREILELHQGTMESLAAACYLRSASRDY
jgi:hypothetical protein